MDGKYCFIIVILLFRYGYGKDCDCKIVDVLKNMLQKDILEREILASRVDMLESSLNSLIGNGASSAGNSPVTLLDEKLTEMKNLIETTKIVQKEAIVERQNAERLNSALENAWKTHKQDFLIMKKDILEVINNNNKSFHDLTIEVEKHMEVMEINVDLLVNQTNDEVTNQLTAAEERLQVIESGNNEKFERYKSQINNDFKVFMNKIDNVRSSDLQRFMSTLYSLAQKIEKDDCATNPCLNGGTCVDGINGYTCVCLARYFGKNCDDGCPTNPCMNSGTCVDSNNRYTCVCAPGYFGKKCDHAYSDLPDCFELRKNGITSSGIYNVTLWKTKTELQVVCDMDTDNGGWTVFQNRFDGSVDFYQNFTSYERGFGELNGEFWLGLKFIQEMASVSQTEMRFDLTAADGSTAYEVQRNFSLTSGPDYKLHIRGISKGTLGDSNSGLLYNSETVFSTFDRDRSLDGDCAVIRRGGWWYYSCTNVNLNGDYAKPGTKSTFDDGAGGMIYYSFKKKESLKSSKMMLRRVA